MSTSWDGAIVVHDEDPADHGAIIQMMDSVNTHNGDITCCAVCVELGMIVTGAADKTVRLWEFETGKAEAVLTFDHEINEVIFLYPYPAIVVADSSGYLQLFGIRGSHFKYHCALTWPNFYRHVHSFGLRVEGSDDPDARVDRQERRDSTGRSLLSPVLAMVWEHQRRILYTGCDRGQLTAFSSPPSLRDLASNLHTPSLLLGAPTAGATRLPFRQITRAK